MLALVTGIFTTNNTKAMVGVDCPEYKPLVVYFSATGTTAKIADRIYTLAKDINDNVDLFEIKPEQPYTDADLDWHNQNSRSSIEMSDKNSRPAIANKIENFDNYNLIFLGFPIWWGREPAIINTFLESYDFSKKIVVPFATSGSSGIEDAVTNIKSLIPNANVVPGKRLSTDISNDDLDTWVSGLVIVECVM